MKGGDKMENKNLGTIIIVTVFVAVITSIITGLIMKNVLLAPAMQAYQVQQTDVNAHRCQADGVCEFNDAFGNKVGADRISLNTMGGLGSDTVAVQSNLWVNGIASFDDYIKLQSPSATISLENNANGDFILRNNGAEYLLVKYNGNVRLSALSGNGTAYLCVGSDGSISRSQTPCV